MNERIELAVEGMSCDHCTGRVKKALEGVEGVRAAEVSLDPGRAVVEGEGLDAAALAAVVTDAGYEARPAG
ncbi:MAG: cation transporter [Gemmatimonadota bacterium]|nr:cation transporter [Gemmatimonadota bacterium]